MAAQADWEAAARRDRPGNGERPTPSLFADLARQAGLLFRQEIALAKAELMEKLGTIGSGTGMILAGARLAFAGFLYVLAAAAIGLAYVVPPWAAALIVGVVVIAIGGILAYVGKRSLSTDRLLPNRTINSLRDDAQWARDQVR
jgi:hypothetical protein